MSIAQEFMKGLNYELPASRKLMARVPTENAAWKPHPKSSALGHLAQLLARMPGTMADIVRGIDMDLATTPAYTFEVRVRTDRRREMVTRTKRPVQQVAS